MTIQYVAGSGTQTNTTQANPSVAVDVGTGSDRLLVVLGTIRGTGTPAISSITYNGTALSQAVPVTSYSGGNLHIYLYYLVNPDTGSNTLSVTFDSTTGRQFVIHAAAFVGVDQTSPLDDNDTAEGSSTTPSVTSTPTQDDGLVFGGVLHESAAALTTGADETTLFNSDYGAWVVSSSYNIQTTATAEAVDWSSPNSDSWIAAAAAFKVAADANTSPTVVLNTADSTTFATDTPTVQFTGTDTDGDDIRYNIQITDSVDFVGGSNIRDNYHGGGGGNFHPQPTATLSWEGEWQTDDRPGMSFTGSGGILEAISHNGLTGDSPASGVAFCRVYQATGPAGSRILLNAADPSATPTPGWLAQSEHASIIGAQSASFWAFTGTNRIWLHSGSPYFFVFNWNAFTSDADNTYSLVGDGSILQAPGNFYNDGWAESNNGSQSIYELFFDIHETNVLLDKVSGTDSGFENSGSAGDTDPFISGCAINFTVQAGDTLTNQREYRWRARGVDPSGTNVYGDWATSRFFFISISGGGSTYDESIAILSFRNLLPLSNAVLDESMSLNKASYVFDGNNIDGISLLEVKRVESVIVSNIITANAELSIGKIGNILQSNNLDITDSLALLAINGYGVLANIVAEDSSQIDKVDNIFQQTDISTDDSVSLGREEHISTLPGLVLSDDLSISKLENILAQVGLSSFDDLAILKRENISADMILSAAESLSLQRGESVSLQTILDAINSISIDRNEGITIDNNANVNSSLSISSIADILLSGGFSVVDSIEIGKIDGIEQNSVYTILGEIAAGRTVNISSSTVLVAESAVIVDSNRNIFLQNIANVNSTVFLGSLLAITQLSETAGGGVVVLYNPIGQSGVIGSIIIRGAGNGSR